MYHLYGAVGRLKHDNQLFYSTALKESGNMWTEQHFRTHITPWHDSKNKYLFLTKTKKNKPTFGQSEEAVSTDINNEDLGWR